jgi:hypothetical protein
MLSRLFWIGLAGVALVAGIALQDGREMLAWTGGDEIGLASERIIEARVEHAVEERFAGREERSGSPDWDAKHEFATAVRELVGAEAHLVAVRIGGESEEEVREAEVRRDAARATVDRLKQELERQEQLSRQERIELRDQIRTETREAVREQIRSAIRN